MQIELAYKLLGAFFLILAIEVSGQAAGWLGLRKREPFKAGRSRRGCPAGM